MYIKGCSGFFYSHVEMVDTKDESNALCIVYAMLFVNTVDTKIKVHNALNSVCYVVCQHCRHKDTDVCGSYTTLYTEQ